MKKLILVLFLSTFICFAYLHFGINEYFSFDQLKINQNNLSIYYQQNTIKVLLLFTMIYIIAVTFSFPGAGILTIGAGAIFGFWVGLLVVSIASSIGATFAFWTSRYLFKNILEKIFQKKLDVLNNGIKKEGEYFLFTLRLMPIFPFFLVNLLMGITSISTLKYFWISFIGMLPGTIIYVNAGIQLSNLQTIKDILTLPLFISLILIGILPLISNYILGKINFRQLILKFKITDNLSILKCNQTTLNTVSIKTKLNNNIKDS